MPVKMYEDANGDKYYQFGDSDYLNVDNGELTFGNVEDQGRDWVLEAPDNWFQTYRIKNKRSNLCLQRSGTLATVATCSNTNQGQRWEFQQVVKFNNVRHPQYFLRGNENGSLRLNANDHIGNFWILDPMVRHADGTEEFSLRNYRYGYYAKWGTFGNMSSGSKPKAFRRLINAATGSNAFYVFAGTTPYYIKGKDNRRIKYQKNFSLDAQWNIQIRKPM